MVKKIVLAFLAIVVALLGYAAMRPADYAVSREVTIHASADKIFPYISNSKLMNEWNPWSALDPKAVMSFSGPESGVGSRTSWENGEKLGTGSATVVESIPNQKVQTKLEYVKPFKMIQTAEMAIRPATDGSSTVVWSVSGRNNLLCRFMGIFVNMDKMVGGIFEQGLANLKNHIEQKG